MLTFKANPNQTRLSAAVCISWMHLESVGQVLNLKHFDFKNCLRRKSGTFIEKYMFIFFRNIVLAAFYSIQKNIIRYCMNPAPF